MLFGCKKDKKGTSKKKKNGRQGSSLLGSEFESSSSFASASASAIPMKLYPRDV